MTFEYLDCGKPILKYHAPTGISFNLAHSENTCLIGVVCGRRIGVDVEWRRAGADYVDVAKYVFSKDETQLLEAADPYHRTQLFFELWTRKEAYLKAIGTGFSSGNNLCEPNPSEWTVVNVSPERNCAGAVAVEGGIARLEWWDWDERG